MDKVFKALANKIRRRILDRLLKTSGLSLSELCEGMAVSRQTVTHHIEVLIEANLVHIEWQGRDRLHFLNPMPIAEIGDRWIDKYSKGRTDAIMRLKAALEQLEGGDSDE